MKNLTQPLLGWPAVIALHIFANVNPVFGIEKSVKSMFPSVFLGLGKGKLGGPYFIKLKLNANLFCLGTPRRIPLEKAVLLELKNMED